MNRALRSALVAAPLALALAACSSPPPSPSQDLVYLGPIPSESTLCTLSPGISTPADAHAVLGMPYMEQSDASLGTTTTIYEFDAHTMPNRTIAILSLYFRSSPPVFSDATAANMPVPSCWAIDGGR
jgi:hypothetical protein